MCGAFLHHFGREKHAAPAEAEDTFKYLYQGNKARFIALNPAGVRKGFEFLEKSQVSESPNRQILPRPKGY